MSETLFWIVPRKGRIQKSELSPSEILALEARGYQRFILGRGKFPAIVGFAEDPKDVGELRRLLNQEGELSNHVRKPRE